MRLAVKLFTGLHAGARAGTGWLWLAALALGLLAGPLLWAASSPDLPAGLIIPAYRPGQVRFHPGDELRYRVSWMGLPVAMARVTLSNEPSRAGSWAGDVWVATNPAIDVVYRFRAHLHEVLGAEELTSHLLTIKQRENRRASEYVVRFKPEAGTVEASRHTSRGTQTKRFFATHPVGPIAGALLALSQPLATGDNLTFDVFVGTNRYVFDFAVRGRETLATDQGGNLTTVKVLPILRYISAGRDHYRVSRVVAWLTADSRHTPVRIMADTFVGRVYVDLVGVGPANQAAR